MALFADVFPSSVMLDCAVLQLSSSTGETSLYKGMFSSAMVNGFYFFVHLSYGFELYQIKEFDSTESSFRI